MAAPITRTDPIADLQDLANRIQSSDAKLVLWALNHIEKLEHLDMVQPAYCRNCGFVKLNGVSERENCA